MRRSVYTLGATVLAGLLTATGAVAETAPVDETPGVHSEEHDRPDLDDGEAYMGWSLRAEQTAQPRALAGRAAPAAVPAPPGVPGIDVSSWQRNVDWRGQWNQGKRFAYVKATEGVAYRNPYFGQQYNGSYDIGMFRGSYHFGRPDIDAGAKEQAAYFVANGGNWSPDGRTLPGVLDIEYNPVAGADKCYDLSPSQMVRWVRDFVTEYKRRTGREAVIYTNLDWWGQCTGNSTAFSETNPLWVARWSSSVGTLPGGWANHTFWQYTDVPLDQDQFNGTLDQLATFATFRDVPADYVFGVEISWLLGQDITTGYDDGTFRPRNKISREAMAAFLYRYAGAPAFRAPARSPFSDLPTTAPFYKEITWLLAQGITTGYDDGTFRPRNQISREAMAAFLYRFEDVSGYRPGPSDFSDVPTGYVFGKEIAWLADQGITTGYDDGTFRPRGKISREATAAFLYRLDRR
ncbi:MULTISPECIES: GH25 family lysozyme [unclassified Pseudactinotalea]|uniref:GH25 family lysozyme n=1 Tax=unclassified Pseudactinotalea TaxID=2649176 RepID=UPI00128B6F41|nr:MULTISPECIES: GH25 family lysozyme [unclassified Pseudactinotalea]MPV50696.1 hypothetical protein [Pseudactinotalea sp. HY160]QGH70068.1 hypothetical protein GCE65_11545 [Pseudactinotalea sp. HY158]